MMEFQIGEIFKLTALTFLGGVFGVCILKIYNLYDVYTAKIDKKSKLHGGSLVAEVLSFQGVKQVFTLVGGHISPILVAADKMGIKVVDTRHEATAVFAADAFARLTGEIGVAIVTAGPGLTNTVTAVKNAQLAESPVLLIGGAAATILKGRGALQDIDQMSLFKSTCKFCATVKTVRQIIPTLRKAIQIALSGTPGPVFVEFPVDTLYPYDAVSKEVIGSQVPKSMKSRLTKWYLEYYLQGLFAHAGKSLDLKPLPVLTPKPNPSLVEKSARLLLKSRRPLIIMGSQSMLLPKSVDRLQSALLKIGVPTFLGGMSRGLLGRNSPIQIRYGRGDALKQADFIILAGSVCDFRLSYGRSLPKKATIVSANRNKEQAQKNSDAFWKPDVVVEGDVSTFIIQLSTMINNYESEEGWLSQLRQKDEAKKTAIFNLSEKAVGEFLNPLGVLLELEKALPDNAIVIADGGDFVGSAAYILRPRGPLRWLDPGAFGTLGVGGGFALGAKLACPDCEIWIVYGDGSCGYSIVEFDTYVRHNIPVIAVVGNDGGWTQIEREQKPMLGSSVGCLLARSDYHTVVQGFGAEGLCTNYEASDISKIFEAARALHSQGKSVLVNVLIGKTSFRDGSISL